MDNLLQKLPSKMDNLYCFCSKINNCNLFIANYFPDNYYINILDMITYRL